MVWCGSMMMAAPFTREPGLSCSRGVDVRLVPVVRLERTVYARRVSAGRRASVSPTFRKLCTAADGFHGDRFDHDLFCAVDETETSLMRLLERALHGGGTAGRDDQRRIGARAIAICARANILILPGGTPWPATSAFVALPSAAPTRAIAVSALSPKASSIACSRVARMSAMAHTVGREQRREGWMSTRGHAKRVGDQTCVLATRAAEAIQRIARDVITRAALEIFLIAFAMFSTAILMKPSATSSAFAIADLLRQVGKGIAHGMRIERKIPRNGPKIFGKKSGNELADHHVGVGDGQRPIAPVAFRAGIGARRIGTDAEARAVEMQD